MRTPLLETRNPQKSYPVYGPLDRLFLPETYMRAVSNMSLNLHEGETYGLARESGCGRNTTGCSILGLVRPDRGEILYRGRDLTRLSDGEFRPLRRDLQMISQDTLSFLNPRSRIRALLEEPLVVQGVGDTKGRCQKVPETLERVGLSEDYYLRYPRELLRGRAQHLGITRAPIIEPKLIICDGLVSALDASVQSQILNMLTSLQGKMDLGILFMSHDIDVMRYIFNHIGVMYLGILMEETGTGQLFAYASHSYTQALFASILDLNKRDGGVSLQGELPMHTDEFEGCMFHIRYPYTGDKCRESAPKLTETRPGHRVACHRVG